jgi:hypothetical protein
MNYSEWQGRQARRLLNGKIYTCYDVRNGYLYFLSEDQVMVIMTFADIQDNWELVTA